MTLGEHDTNKKGEMMNATARSYGLARRRRVSFDDWNQQLALSCWIVTGQWPIDRNRFGQWTIPTDDEETVSAVFDHCLRNVDRGDKQPFQTVDVEALRNELRLDCNLLDVEFTDTMERIIDSIPKGLRQDVLTAYETMTPLPLSIAGIIAHYIPRNLELSPEWCYCILRCAC